MENAITTIELLGMYILIAILATIAVIITAFVIALLVSIVRALVNRAPKLPDNTKTTEIIKNNKFKPATEEEERVFREVMEAIRDARKY